VTMQMTSAGGLSTARLKRMHDVMAGHVESGDIPGLVTLVSRRGEIHVDTIGHVAIGGERHHFPHHLDDQADYGGCRDDPC